MAERLILSLLLAGWSAGSAALAQPLADPMRPPAAAATSSEPGEATKSAAQLQSILISPRRRVAVIDGRVVRLGERVGDATVVAISDSEVVLQRADARETLKLNPAVEKKAVESVPVGRQPARVVP